MSLPFTIDELENHIIKDKDSCARLHKLLLEEQEALKNRKPEVIENILEKKTALLLLLESSAKTRLSWAQSVSKEPLQKTWEEILNESNKPSLKVEWEALKVTTERCKQQNEINGKLLASGKKALGRVLDVFRGKTANPSLYNAYGSSSTQSQTNKVGEA